MVAQAVLKDNLLLLFSESAWRLPGSLKYAVSVSSRFTDPHTNPDTQAIDLMGETLSKHGPNKQYLRSLVSMCVPTQYSIVPSSDFNHPTL